MTHGAHLLHCNKNKLAANMHTCTVLLQREGRVHIEMESDRRRQGDWGRERAGRSQEVGKENEMKEGINNGWQLPHVWIGVSHLWVMLLCWEAGKKRERGTQKAMTGLFLYFSFSPSFHTIHRQTASHHHGQRAMLFIHLQGVLLCFYFYHSHSDTFAYTRKVP